MVVQMHMQYGCGAGTCFCEALLNTLCMSLGTSKDDWHCHAPRLGLRCQAGGCETDAVFYQSHKNIPRHTHTEAAPSTAWETQRLLYLLLVVSRFVPRRGETTTPGSMQSASYDKVLGGAVSCCCRANQCCRTGGFYSWRGSVRRWWCFVLARRESHSLMPHRPVPQQNSGSRFPCASVPF